MNKQMSADAPWGDLAPRVIGRTLRTPRLRNLRTLIRFYNNKFLRFHFNKHSTIVQEFFLLLDELDPLDIFLSWTMTVST